MAKVLLVDTNFSSQPIYDAISRLGHEVHVVGSNPLDSLAKSCTNYRQVDYADTEDLAKLIAREGYDHLVPGCTDRSYTSCALVSKGRFQGISPSSVDKILNQKDHFRALTNKLGLPSPKLQWNDTKYLTPTQAGHVWRFPLVVKPVDSYSGKGVEVILEPNEQAIAAAMTKARHVSSRRACIVEDFVLGDLYSHSAFIQERRIINDFFVEEYGTAYPLAVDTSCVSINLPTVVRLELRDAVETIASELELSDGLIHTQFIRNGNRHWIIEVTRRCPGDLYSQLIELTCGNGYIKSYIAPFLGLPLPSTTTKMNKPTLRHTVSVTNPQRFGYLNFDTTIQIIRWIPLALTGDHLHASPKSRIGILFASANDENHLREMIKLAKKRKLYHVSENYT